VVVSCKSCSPFFFFFQEWLDRDVLLLPPLPLPWPLPTQTRRHSCGPTRPWLPKPTKYVPLFSLMA